MNGKELDYVREIVDSEGFDYTFIDYSDFSEIEDAEFHRLRKEYIKASNELKTYLNIV